MHPPMTSRRKVIFMHDNEPSHSAKVTTSFLDYLDNKGDSLMNLPACSPDLNSIENDASILKQFSSKADLWKAFKDAVSSVPHTQMKANLIDQRPTF